MKKNEPSPEAMKNLYKFIARVLPKYSNELIRDREVRRKKEKKAG